MAAKASGGRYDVCGACEEKMNTCQKQVPVQFWFGDNEPYTPEMQRLAKELVKKWGHSAMGGFMQWGRSDVNPELGAIVPQPKQMEGATFTVYEMEDALRYAAVLNTLRGKPVLVTGGGGTGAYWGFLARVEVIPGRPYLMDKATGNPYRGQDGLPVQDPNEPISSAHVRVHVIPFPPSIEPPEPMSSHFRDGEFDPWLGSWRINAVRGHGEAEMLAALEHVEGHQSWEK